MGYPLSGPVWRSLFKQKVIRDWSDFHLQIFGNIDVWPWSLQIECDLLVVVAVVVEEVLFFTGPKARVWALTGPKFAVVIKESIGTRSWVETEFFYWQPCHTIEGLLGRILFVVLGAPENFFIAIPFIKVMLTLGKHLHFPWRMQSFVAGGLCKDAGGSCREIFMVADAC